MEQRQCGLIPPPTVVREELARNYEQARWLRRLLKLSEDAAVESHRRVSEYRPRRKPKPEATLPEGVAS
jgi:hypothetical protein